jgi:hypothetical protein
MVSGKCKRKSEAFLKAQSQSLKKLKKKNEKMRKPVVERRTSQGVGGNPSSTEQAIDGLVEFFTSLSTQYPATASQQQGEASSSSSSNTASSPETVSNNPDEIRELDDMGALARDLIRRIQRLRDQFRPGSLAAMALPDIRVQGDMQAAARMIASDAAQRMAHEAMAIRMAADFVGSHQLPPLPAPHAIGNLMAPPFTLAQGGGDGGPAPEGFAAADGLFHPPPDLGMPELEEFDEEEDDGQFEVNESSTE